MNCRSRVLIVASLSFLGMAAMAAPADLTTSADCRQALDAMQAQENVAVAHGNTPASQPLLTLRHRAALACFGSAADRPQPLRRSVQAPIVIAPVGIARPLPMPAAPTPSAAPTVKSPLVVTACDAGGCRASDGSRLDRIGPNLVGPRGICTLQGTLLNCP